MAQRRWASERCSATRTCSQSSLPTHVQRNTSPMRVSCKRCVARAFPSGPIHCSPLFFPASPACLVQLNLVQQNPQLAQSLLSSDPRMIDVLGALMGIDMQGFNRPEGSDDVPPGVPPSAASPPSSSPSSASHAPPPAASSSKAPVPDDVKMAEVEEEADDGDNEDAAAKAAAEAEKKLGVEAYKKRDFAVAITHFTKAWETWPKDITFLTNLGGGFFFSIRLFLFVCVWQDLMVLLVQRRTLSKATTTSQSRRARRPLTRVAR